MALPRQSHSTDSLRKHWLQFYEYYSDKGHSSVDLHLQLTAKRCAVDLLNNMLTFTVSDKEEAVSLFQQLDAVTTLQNWTADEDKIEENVISENLNEQSLIGYSLTHYILLMWLTKQYDLANIHLARLRQMLIRSHPYPSKSNYYCHLGMAMICFKNKVLFEIPEPTSQYRKDHKYFASLFQLMNSLVTGEDVQSFIKMSDSGHTLSNKGKRTPKGYDLNDGEHRLKMPWNIHKYYVLQYAEDNF